MKRWALITAAAGVAAAGVGSLGLGWVIARKLTAPISARTYDLVIRAVEHDGDATMVVLDRNRSTAAPGAYNLWLEQGGWVLLGDEAHQQEAGKVARLITGASDRLCLKPGDRASWSGIYFATPQDAGLDARDVKIRTPEGYAPAWRIDGDPSIWAVHVHGLGSTRAGTLRGALVATELGYTSLIVSYRNDGEGPRVGNGRSTLGFAEADDVEEAIGYAVRRGAERIVLFGWSMGAAIALQVADRLRDRRLIAALVLESPVLSWPEVIEENCKRAGLPRAAGKLALPWLTNRGSTGLLGLPCRIPLESFDWMRRVQDLAVPTLILHGAKDDSVPVSLSVKFAVQRPDVVQLETFEAGHTMTWNSDRERWKHVVSQWLLRVDESPKPGTATVAILSKDRAYPDKIR